MDWVGFEPTTSAARLLSLPQSRAAAMDERELFKSHPLHLFFARVLASTIQRGLRKRVKAALKTRQLWQGLVLAVWQKGK
jgi:hypothetical protein